MHNLDKALAFSNYQATLSNQKRILLETFQDQCLLGYNGGLFFITPEFIAGLDVLGSISRYVIDHNQNPIWISEINDLKIQAITCYSRALEVYGVGYEKLKTQRSVSTLVGL